MSKKNEWSDILAGIPTFESNKETMPDSNKTPKTLFTEATEQEPTPAPSKTKPTLKKDRKITTARIDHRKLLLIKFIYSDDNAFEALDKVVDFWIENNEKEISTKFDKAMDWLNQ